MIFNCLMFHSETQKCPSILCVIGFIEGDSVGLPQIDESNSTGDGSDNQWQKPATKTTARHWWIEPIRDRAEAPLRR